jgi:hypothetical protein
MRGSLLSRSFGTIRNTFYIRAMTCRFRLRALFAIAAAIALCLGGSVNALRLMVHPRGDTVGNALVAVANLPLFVVCALGGLAIYESRLSYPVASRRALIALSMLVAWRFASSLLMGIYMYWTSSEAILWFARGHLLISALVEATCWGLVLIAFLEVVRRPRQSDEDRG